MNRRTRGSDPSPLLPESNPRGGGRLWACLAILLLAPGAALAQISLLTTGGGGVDAAALDHPFFEVDAGVVRSDNVHRTNLDPVSDTIATTGFILDGKHDGPRLDYAVASDIVLAKYFSESYGVQPFGAADAQASFAIVPQVFDWTARETFTQPIIDPLQPVTPDNLENLNYISTGPRLTLTPGGNTQVLATGTYSLVKSSSKSPAFVSIDGKRYSGDVTVSHALSQATSVYVDGTALHADFDDQTINTNFTRSVVAAGYKIQDSRTRLDVSAGYAKLKIADESPSGMSMAADLSRKVSSRVTVTLHAARQFTDAADVFRFSFDRVAAATQPDRLATGNPFKQTEFGGSWRFETSRTTLQLGYLLTRERYERDPLADRNLQDLSVTAERVLGPVLRFQLVAQYERDNSPEIGSSYDSLDAQAILRWQLGRRLGLSFRYQRSQRDAQSVLTGYRENQYGVTAYYQLTPPAALASQQGD